MACSWWEPYHGKVEHLYLHPREWGLGQVTDIFGRRWHVYGYAGNNGCQIAWAVPLGQVDPYYTDTSGFGGWSHGATTYRDNTQSWPPYYVHRVETIEGGRYDH